MSTPAITALPSLFSVCKPIANDTVLSADKANGELFGITKASDLRIDLYRTDTTLISGNHECEDFAGPVNCISTDPAESLADGEIEQSVAPPTPKYWQSKKTIHEMLGNHTDKFSLVVSSGNNTIPVPNLTRGT
jgi:hypothetical protein